MVRHREHRALLRNCFFHKRLHETTRRIGAEAAATGSAEAKSAFVRLHADRSGAFLLHPALVQNLNPVAILTIDERCVAEQQYTVRYTIVTNSIEKPLYRIVHY